MGGDKKTELVKLPIASRAIWKKHVVQNLRYLDTPVMRLRKKLKSKVSSLKYEVRLILGCDLYSGVTYTPANTVHMYVHKYDKKHLLCKLKTIM